MTNDNSPSASPIQHTVHLVFGYKVFLKVYFNVKIHADFKSVGSQTQKVLYRHIPMHNYSLAYILAYMEFTTLIIMVGHLDPDTPLTNVHVSVTRIILWRVF